VNHNLKNQSIDRGEFESKLEQLFEQTDINCTKEQIEKLVILLELLCKWNASLNLTAIRDPKQMLILHIMDSAVISPLLCGNNIADVGTGPGFPGLVLAILNPDKKFTLIDSIAKKLSFVRTVMVSLQLKNVTIINDRCENIKCEQKFDCIVSRAFAPLARFVGWCLPLIADNGTFVAMKANLEEQELLEVPPSVKIDKIVSLKVPELVAARQAVMMSPVSAQ
jgi:16S rRNA (guanine527-N7)-methyltransferase